jgi:choline kinase
MKAVILAAGRGSRLNCGTCLAKGMVTVGGRPIVERSINLLAAGGIDEIVLILGHRADDYSPVCHQFSGLVHPVMNHEYATSGSLGSLVRAIEVVDGPILCFECDLLFEHRLVRRLIETPAPDAIAVAPISGSGDEVFVAANKGTLLGLSKDRTTLKCSHLEGEFVGASKLSMELCDVIRGVFERSSFKRGCEYDIDGLTAAADSVHIECCYIDDLVWCEIDNDVQLSSARSLTWPTLAQLEHNNRAG